MAFIFPISCILALIFPILIKYFPKCVGKGSFPKSQIKSLTIHYKALRKGLSIPSETMFEYPCPFACYYFKNTVENSNVGINQIQMSNIEYLRQLHHTKLNLKRTQFRIKEFYSYKKDIIFRFCVKDLIFIYYVHEKSLDFGRFIVLGNK